MENLTAGLIGGSIASIQGRTNTFRFSPKMRIIIRDGVLFEIISGERLNKANYRESRITIPIRDDFRRANEGGSF